tara:strand:- start:198 stop:356 length:159 start_codon:yes stop_codon:yes gene_type:complete
LRNIFGKRRGLSGEQVGEEQKAIIKQATDKFFTMNLILAIKSSKYICQKHIR